MSGDSERPAGGGERWIAWVFVGCLIHAVWAMSTGWNHSVMGLHGFRQTQTAMAVERLLAGSSWLRYETPFLGVPWSIPFEFPLFQWIVAAACKLLGTPIVQTARFVSIAFFLGTLVPLISLQSALGIRGNRRLILPSLLLVSPIYIFWSRTVMIESTALFFATAYLALLASFLFAKDSGRTGILCLAAVCGAVGAMVKITTFATFLLGAVGLFVLAHRSAPMKRTGLTSSVAVLLTLALPTLAGLAWTRFAEGQRELNPLAQPFLTGATMSRWFLGTLRDRLSAGAWEITLSRTVRDTVGNWGVVLGAVFLSFALGTIQRRRFLTCLALFIAAPLLILHLHRTHEYYPYANAVFLLASIASVIVGALASGPLLRRLGVGLLGLALLSGFVGYQRFYRRVQVLDVRLDPGLVSAVQQSVGVDGVLVIFGAYWSSEIPYYLHRPAIMNRDNSDLASSPMRQAREGLNSAGYRVEGLLTCHRTPVDPGVIQRSVAVLGLASDPTYRGPDCDFYGLPR